MIIILSPSKTMDMSNACFQENHFSDKTEVLVEKIKKFSKQELSGLMKIKGKLLDSVYNMYDRYENAPLKAAIESYTGFVFKELNLNEYTEDQQQFLDDHFVILSALYGCVHPSDKIREYRLDMTIKVDENESLYSFWKDEINSSLEKIMRQSNEDTLVNLASNEFSKLVDRKKFPFHIIDIDFMEKTGNSFRSVSTYSKKARGMMSDYIIKNKISDIKNLKDFKQQRYEYNKALSNDNTYIFTR